MSKGDCAQIEDATGKILASQKFASAFYGPFRDVCSSSPDENIKLKDRRTYQLDPCNLSSALLAAQRDLQEGADIIMVKPALAYLDIIRALDQEFQHPIAAYHVSGEYQSIELMASHNLIDRSASHLEVWTAINRSGANMIISYASRHAKKWLAS